MEISILKRIIRSLVPWETEVPFPLSLEAALNVTVECWNNSHKVWLEVICQFTKAESKLELQKYNCLNEKKKQQQQRNVCFVIERRKHNPFWPKTNNVDQLLTSTTVSEERKKLKELIWCVRFTTAFSRIFCTNTNRHFKELFQRSETVSGLYY